MPALNASSSRLTLSDRAKSISLPSSTIRSSRWRTVILSPGFTTLKVFARLIIAHDDGEVSHAQPVATEQAVQAVAVLYGHDSALVLWFRRSDQRGNLLLEYLGFAAAVAGAGAIISGASSGIACTAATVGSASSCGGCDLSGEINATVISGRPSPATNQTSQRARGWALAETGL